MSVDRRCNLICVPPKSLSIITGTGISYTRNDGINVISLASLGVV